MEKQKKIDQKRQEIEEDNIIRVAGKEEAIYNQVIVDKLQRYDEVVISVTDAYKERVEVMIQKWSRVGLEVVGARRWGLVPWTQKHEEIFSKESKKPMITLMNQVTLRKHPDFFKHTDY